MGCHDDPPQVRSTVSRTTQSPSAGNIWNNEQTQNWNLQPDSKQRRRRSSFRVCIHVSCSLCQNKRMHIVFYQSMRWSWRWSLRPQQNSDHRTQKGAEANVSPSTLIFSQSQYETQNVLSNIEMLLVLVVSASGQMSCLFTDSSLDKSTNISLP